MRRNSIIRSLIFHLGGLRPRSGILILPEHSINYVPIPKNANSFLKSLVLFNNKLANGFDPTRFTPEQWLNSLPLNQRRKLEPRLLDLLSNNQKTFAVIRCPVRRVVSCYLDRLVLKGPRSPIVNQFCADLNTVTDKLRKPEDITFSDFLDFIVQTPDVRRNIHYMTQSRFLKFIKVDDMFTLENISEVVYFLESMGLKVTLPVGSGARVWKRTVYEKVPGMVPNAYKRGLGELSQRVRFPRAEDFMNDVIFAKVNRAYGVDIALYLETTGKTREEYFSEIIGLHPQT